MKEFQVTDKIVDSITDCLKKFEFETIDNNVRDKLKTSICNHLLGICVNMENVQVICDKTNNFKEDEDDGKIIYTIIETNPESKEEKVHSRFI